MLDFSAGFVLGFIDQFPRASSRARWRLGMSAEDLALDHRPDVSVTKGLWQLPMTSAWPYTFAGFGGFGCREIAGTMQRPVGTVLSRLHRGRSRLGFRLKRAG